jgi:hypothetical protein
MQRKLRQARRIFDQILPLARFAAGNPPSGAAISKSSAEGRFVTLDGAK